MKAKENWGHYRCVIGLIFLFTQVSCDATPSSIHEGMDASMESSNSTDAGSTAPHVEIGTGETSFQSIMMNQEFALVLGPQGTGRLAGYHLWGGVRARNMDSSGRVNLIFTVTRTSDELEVAKRQWDKMLQPSVLGDEFYALPIIMTDCCEVRGQDLRIELTATDISGQTASNSMDIRAGGICADVDGREICP